MQQDDHTDGKTLSRGQVSLLGRVLFICGAVLLAVALGSIQGAAVFCVVVGVGCIWVGTWLSTTAKTMPERPVGSDKDARSES